MSEQSSILNRRSVIAGGLAAVLAAAVAATSLPNGLSTAFADDQKVTSGIQKDDPQKAAWKYSKTREGIGVFIVYPETKSEAYVKKVGDFLVKLFNQLGVKAEYFAMPASQNATTVDLFNGGILHRKKPYTLNQDLKDAIKEVSHQYLLVKKGRTVLSQYDGGQPVAANE